MRRPEQPQSSKTRSCGGRNWAAPVASRRRDVARRVSLRRSNPDKLDYLHIGIFPLDTDYIAIPALVASLVMLVAVSLLTKPSTEDKWKPFFD